ncbi:hypothetical protein HD597_000858 [Nonomuraea thailandensis]|uniref:Uncharacterized protein n=1 Tax=Nonomuraea thailandensis TaxID=1188745 RepID=A0A9X2GFS5_9ACTN|nr:hypothetical protein [Nonomuraea thailandensis]MCP2353838.1 hypothetical protein [Nonomuraea thailandensis]
MDGDLYDTDGDQDVARKYTIGDSYAVLIPARRGCGGEKSPGPIIEGPHKGIHRKIIGFRHRAAGDETPCDSFVQNGEGVIDMAKKLGEIPFRAGRPAWQ